MALPSLDDLLRPGSRLLPKGRMNRVKWFSQEPVEDSGNVGLGNYSGAHSRHGNAIEDRYWRRLMVEIELRYDRLGSRLQGIGSVSIDYDRLGSRPRHLGWLELAYDHVGSRLCGIGDLRLSYDRLGSRPRMLGSWQLDYDWLGSRLRRVGPYDVFHDRLGSRIQRVGQMTVEYDHLGSRPKHVVLPDNAPDLSEDDLIALFFALHLQSEEEADKKSSRRARPGTG